jgi:hypothetical protein
MAAYWRSPRRRTRRSAWNRTRRDLYLGQRTMGDLSAASRGPGALSRRLVRRAVLRDFFATLRRL